MAPVRFAHQNAMDAPEARAQQAALTPQEAIYAKGLLGGCAASRGDANGDATGSVWHRMETLPVAPRQRRLAAAAGPRRT